MKNFKNALIGIVIMITIFSIVYLLGSFCSCSFNPCYWSELSKAVVTLLGGVIALILGVAYVIGNTELSHEKT